MTKNIYEIPKTYTIAYYNPETEENINLSQEQLKTITNPSEIKVINHGESYQSWKALVGDPNYGPSNFWEYLGKKIASTALVVSYFTPIAPLTVAATIGVGALGAGAMYDGNEELGGNLLEIASEAGLSYVGAKYAGPSISKSLAKTTIKP